MTGSQSSSSTLTTAMMSKLSVFASFEERELNSLASVMRSVHFLRGAVIYAEGKASRGFYVVAEGEVRLTKRLGRARREIMRVTKNSLLGQVPLVDSGLNFATATAHTDVRALACDRDVFGRMAASPAHLALKLYLPLVTACCRAARAADAMLHGLYADPQGTLLTLHIS